MLSGLVLGGWFLYFSFVPPAYVAQNAIVNNTEKELATTNGVMGEEGIFQGNGFRIKPPSGWGVGNAAAMKVTALFINPAEDKTKTNVFHSNINVVAESTTLTLDDYVALNKGTLQKSVKKYSSTEFQKTTVGGRAGYMIGGIFAQDGEQLRNRQLIIVESGMAYIITGTSLDSAWSKYVKQINAALTSFDL